ncbi:hypothetical protein K438DRAFT_1779457 [Mycena galopus ATCC 62051]|nr:hypothetical protein K438DRAFT_1784677 [Mycena galopus ATCC 62051]KAF8148959.1 hypothetical protein K438DRAFT_1779457 [Mycena galopus ATCC 62051]
MASKDNALSKIHVHHAGPTVVAFGGQNSGMMSGIQDILCLACRSEAKALSTNAAGDTLHLGDRDIPLLCSLQYYVVIGFRGIKLTTRYAPGTVALENARTPSCTRATGLGITNPGRRQKGYIAPLRFLVFNIRFLYPAHPTALAPTQEAEYAALNRIGAKAISVFVACRIG